MTSITKNERPPIEELFETVFKYSAIDMQTKMEQMPDACPLDLLTDDEAEQLQEIIDSYGALSDIIDPHYVALLIALSQYERIDIDAKIKEHIAKRILEKV